MCAAIDFVQALTDPVIPINQKREIAKAFSREFGWRPNDILDAPSALPAANLVVEHGLDHAAMLSFLPSDRRLMDIQIDERRRILGLSYNSLIDWHLCIDQESIQCLYNRSSPPAVMYMHRFDQSGYSALEKRVFEEAIGLAPNPNVLALDGALLDTISTWRRILRMELRHTVSTESLSALFNAVILARAIEDFYARVGTATPYASLRERVAHPHVSIADAIQESIAEHTNARVSPKLLNHSALEPFTDLSLHTRITLVEAFYRHEAVPYDYDFSVMSRHALSRIYERYIAVIQHEEAVQFSMFPSAPEESWNKQLGGIYTPQYIASFFARYLRSQTPVDQFMESSVLDPACGSGVFLRAAMEQKLLAHNGQLGEATDTALHSLVGIDIDESAVAAAGLSLALLYLAARGKLPEDVPISHDDSMSLFAVTPVPSTVLFDSVMANPPFVRTELQSDEVRHAVAEHTGVAAGGKRDTYLAFLVFSIRALRPGGFGCFVVPQPLLTSDNLKSLRDWILDEAWVRVIADVSAIRVFKTNVYVVLLIVQRKNTLLVEDGPVSLIRCQGDVGLALEDFLDGKHRRTSSYFIFEARQNSLRRATWSVIHARRGRPARKAGSHASPHRGCRSTTRSNHWCGRCVHS